MVIYGTYEQIMDDNPSTPLNGPISYWKSDGFLYVKKTDGSEKRIYPEYKYEERSNRISLINSTWVSYNVSQGWSNSQINRTRGTGATPTQSDNDMPMLVLPSGAILHELTVQGRFNNAEVTGLEYYVFSITGDYIGGSLTQTLVSSGTIPNIDSTDQREGIVSL